MKYTVSTKILHCFLLVVLAVVLIPDLLEAAELGNPVLSVRGLYIHSTDVDERSSMGEVAETFALVSLSVPIYLTEQSQLELDLSADQIHFSWKNPERLGFSNGLEPWDDLNSIYLGLKYTHYWKKNWAYFIGCGFGDAWEEELSDAYSYNAYIGIVRHWSPNWSGYIGVGYNQGLEDTRFDLPSAGLYWNQTRRKDSPSGWSAAIEWPPEGNISYTFNQRWKTHLSFGGFGKSYRLAEDNKLSPSGILNLGVGYVGLFMDFRPSKLLIISLGVIKYTSQVWDIQNDDGDSIEDVNTDSTEGLQFTVSWTF
jgi:hypothetical protein